ncbi:MAG: hypothetical protein H6Q84_2938 [Deltaproteobacteria bacterium]|nr:hypothetical protein [Deltaproteobacteria bacterium]
MDCKETLERLSDYRDGSLSGTVAEEISRHLGECAGCAEIMRSLDAVRKGLLGLPPVPAPPELLGRIHEAIASEGGAASSSAGGPAADAPARSVFSRLKVPLETAAAVLLLASAYWYWAESPPATTARPAGPAAPPVEIASPAPTPVVPPPPVRVAGATPRTVTAPPLPVREAKPADRGEERSIASLPEDTPDPKVRVYSLADLPASPVLRASTRFNRILPPSQANAPAGESRSADTVETPEPSAAAAQTARLRPPFPYGRDVSLETDPEDREEAAERIRETARRLGGTVEGTDRDAPEGTVAVRVLLPERTAQAFIDELGRIGKIPPEGMPARSVLPAGPAPGTNAYTVRLRTR